MNLLLLTRAFDARSPRHAFVHGIACGMAGRGHEVTLCAWRGGAPDDDAPYRILRYRRPIARRLVAPEVVSGLLEASGVLRPDVAHAEGLGDAARDLDQWSRRTGVPWSLRPFESDDDVLRLREVADEPLLRRALISADRVLAPNPFLLEELAGAGVRVKRLTLANEPLVPESPAGHALDIDSDGAVRRRVKAPASPGAERAPTAIHVGDLNERAGLVVLLEAFEQVHASRPDARLVIAGAGPERRALEHSVYAAGLESVVELREATGAPPGDLFVDASLAAPLGDAARRGLARGLPLVLSDVGAHPALVEDGVNGRLVPKGDPRGLAAALLELFADAAQRERLALASRERAAGLGWERTLDDYAALFEAVAR